MGHSPGVRSITIRDVARLAGVSAATVSKVLNDGPGVAPSTRDRVRLTVDRIGYRPNSIARSLKAHRTSTIGLLTDDLHGDNTTAMMHGVEEVAGDAGFGVMLCNSYGERDRERAQLEMLMDKRVDGVILMSGRRIEERAGPALSLGSLPSVFLFRYTLDLPVPGIVPDDQQGGRIATEHLLALGRRRIALVSGPRHFETSTLRADGYREALAAADVPIDPRYEVTGETWYEDTGYAAAHRLMSLPEPPDAIFCGRDNIAAGVLDALHELGLRVPEDVAVVGYHDLPGAAHQRPPLTSVARPLLEMGRRAGSMLIDAIDGRPHAPGVVRMPCRLVQRRSCGGATVP
jgi:LacI family transcriptional regulator